MIPKINIFVILILIYIYSVQCEENNNSFKQNALFRYRRQSNQCRGRFLCTNFNQCIHFKLVCNGKKDCSDGSDEIDCDDSSTTQKNSCPAPKIHNGYFNIEEKFATQYVQGNPIPDTAFINIKCNENYVLQPNFDLIGCNDGKWSISFPQCLPICPEIKTLTSEPTQCYMNDNFIQCDQQLLEALAISKCKSSNNSTLKGLATSICSEGSWYNIFDDCIYGHKKINTCPPRVESNSIEVNCTLNNKPVDCTKTVKEGTIAISKCKNYYNSIQGDISISTCTDGAWDSPPIQCEPECGEEVPDGMIFIINNGIVKKSQFPWPVGIYLKDQENYNYHCSGTLISPTAILSVAHCFSYPYNNIAPENFFIGAGKGFKNYTATEKFAQNRQVKSIHIPPNYNANEGDIAVIIVKDAFELTNIVRPVCVDWDGTVESQNYNPSALGNVVVWRKSLLNGTTERESRETDTRNQLTKEECLKNISPMFYSDLTEDKICTTFSSASELCHEDRGNGLAFKLNFNYTQKYFLRGVASTGQSNICTNYSRALYTKVAQYTDFIKKVTQQNEDITCPPRYRQLLSTEVKCILNGIFVDCSQPVLDGTIAVSRCKNPDSSKSRIKFSVSKCSQGAWNKPLINCQSSTHVTTDLCPPRMSETTKVKCLLEDKPVNCNTSVAEGTVAIADCKDFYVPIGNEISISRCTKGSWNNPLIHCKPLQPIKLECGEAVPGGELFSVNTENSKKGAFPWHVAIYRLQQDSDTHKYKCGGSIITPKIVLSAAHCFTEVATGDLYPAEEFHLGAGKYYREYNSKEDIHAQMQQVKEYHLPETYRGYDTNYAGDLAVVVVKEPFKLSTFVQPVCIEWDNKIENQQLVPNNRGNVVGWGSTDPYDQTKLSDELKQLNAPYIGVKDCLDTVPPNFRRWVTSDKFCAGYTNGSSVCAGDSGGGMVFKWVSDNLQKYYLRGIVSVGPTDYRTNLICDNNRYTAYTKVSVYSNFILNIIKQNLQE